jgi:hypothetical protein
MNIFGNAKSLEFIIRIASIISAIILLIIGFLFLFNREYNISYPIENEAFGTYGDFIGGVIGTFLTFVSVLLLYSTLKEQQKQYEKQQLENHFFKMIDYHNNIVSTANSKSIFRYKDREKEILKGRSVFANIKIQLQYLLRLINNINEEKKLKFDNKTIIDIAVMVSYYGLDDEWQDLIVSKVREYFRDNQSTICFVKELLKKINTTSENLVLIISRLDLQSKRVKEDSKSIELGRTNQTILSSYFRNMYNAIRLVDNSKILDVSEKKKLIKIYRAQLSNPELYILFLNVVSRFGRKWLYDKDNEGTDKDNLILKYEFIKNLPLQYCENYSPKDFFDINYEEEELMN